MEFSGEFDAMSSVVFLDHVDDLTTSQRQLELKQLRAAAHWAARNGEGSVNPGSGKARGRESLRLFGGAGTPKVASFAGAVLGTRMGRSPAFGDSMIADALDLMFRLPVLWARVVDGEVWASYARFVARRTRHLGRDAAGYVDARVAESADGRISWARFESLVEAAVKAADPEVARLREEAAQKHQFAKQTHNVTEGLGCFLIRADLAVILRVNATVTYLARLLKETGVAGDADRLRVLAVALMANPAQATQFMAAYQAWQQAGSPKPDQPDQADQPDQPDQPDGSLGRRGKDAGDPNQPPLPDPDGGPAAGGPGDGGPGDGGPDDGSDPDADPWPDDDADDPDSQDAVEEVAAAVAALVALTGWTPDGSKPGVDWRSLLPRVELVLHLYGGQVGPDGQPPRFDPDGLVRIEGQDTTVTTAWVRGVLGERAKFTIRPMFHPLSQAPVDAWETPDRHRKAVRVLSPADVFPFATATVNRRGGWQGAQHDHTDRFEWDDDGNPAKPDQSRIGNYSPLTQFHHNLKTHGGWQAKQPFPGIWIWRDPYGGYYLIDHTGTRHLNHG